MEIEKLFITLAINAADFARGLSDSLRQAKQWAGQFGRQVTSILSKAFLAGLAVVLTAIAGIGVAAFNVANDIQNASASIQSELGTTAEEADRLADIAAQAWGNNFADSIEESAGAVALVRQQLGDLADDELLRATENAFRLRDAFDVDVNESINTAQVLMREFGLTSDEAFDFITTGMQQGLNANDDFIDSIGEYSNLFSDAGFDAGQFFSIMETGAAGGVLGTDKISDAIKEMGIILNEGGADVAQAFGDIGLNFAEIEASVRSGDEAWADYFPQIVDGINDIEDPIERARVQTELFGTMAEDLGVSFTEGLSDATTALGDMAGATQTVDARYQTMGDVVEGFRRRALLALEPIGAVLLDLANRIMPYVEQGFAFIEERIAPMLATVSENVAVFLDEFERGFAATGDVLSGLEEGFDNFLTEEQLEKVYAFSDGLRLATDWLTENQTAIQGAVLALAGAGGLIVVLTTLGTILGVLLSPITLLVAGIALIGAAIATNFAGLADTLAQVWQGILFWWEGVKAFFNGDLQAWGENMTLAWETIWTAVVEFLGNLWAMVEPVLQEWYTAITNWFNEQDWEALAQTAMDFINEKLGEFWETVKETIDGWYTAFVEWFDEQDWEQLAFDMVTKLLTELDTFTTRVLTTLVGWYNSVKAWFGSQDWSSLATDVVDGIVSGLGSLTDRLTGALLDAAAGAKGAWDAYWGIRSPSRLMMQASQDIVTGAEIPIETADLSPAMAGMAERMYQPVEMAMGLADGARLQGQAGGGDVDRSQTFQYNNYGADASDPVDWFRYRERVASIA